MHPILRKRALALAITSLFTTAHANEPATPSLGTIEVTATRVAYAESAATYAAEVHTRAMIERSGAQTLPDYLAQQSSLTVMSSYGNRFTPTLEMRGYGLESGNQNIVISVDGQRLNEIDQAPQLLGALPITSIERIEIIKGSGSVLNGDGAMAGVINISTRHHDGGSVEVRVGDHGAQAGSFNWGTSGENYRVSVGADNDRLDGFAHQDPSGKSDDSELTSYRAALGFNPTQALELKFDAASSRTDVRYQNWLTPTQFKADPSQNGGRNYTQQVTDVDRWHAGLAYALSDTLRLSYDHRRMDKTNRFGRTDTGYDQVANDLALIYTGADVDLTAGLQQSDASRSSLDSTPANHMSKDNHALFAQAAWRLGATTLSLGGRQEWVDYRYAPLVGTTLNADEKLAAWDLGINQRLSDHWSLFANLNRAFQAPDVDRFFTYNWLSGSYSFNGLINPAKAKTLTTGAHYSSPALRSKVALFRANLRDEIYYNPATFANTNIDESHKYGLETDHRWQATADLLLGANYVWTRARIDKEDSGNGAYDGKTLPGVPEHALNLSASYKITERTELTLTHAWRDRCYAISDFDNNSRERQARFESTNLNLRFRTKQIDYFASINNLFAHENGMWVSDDSMGQNVVYPGSYERSMIVGAQLRF